MPSSACVLLAHTPHGRRQLAPPGGGVLGFLVTCTPVSQAQATALGSSFASAAYLSLRCAKQVRAARVRLRRPRMAGCGGCLCSNFHRPIWACGDRPPAPKQHTPTPVEGAFAGWAIATAPTVKIDLGLLTPNFPLFTNKQSQRHFSLGALRTWVESGCFFLTDLARLSSCLRRHIMIRAECMME